jgi:hypothetical protein
MRTRAALTALGVAIVLGATPLSAQTDWTPLVETKRTKVWFDPATG